MASKYDKKQGIDGIATLTNDTLAKQNIRNVNLSRKKQTRNRSSEVKVVVLPPLSTTP